MRFLISGLGSAGRRHLRNLTALGQNDIVLHRTGRATLPDEDLAGFPVERDLRAALESGTPDAVIVANPTALHLEVAIPAAHAGCHLLIEKPLSHSLERIDALQEALSFGGGSVLIGFQFRFHPGLERIAALLSGGELGRPLSVKVHWGEYLPDWHPWEDYRASYSARADLGGGVVRTLSHPFDYLRWLFGEAASVQAEIGQLSDLELEVEDTADILLRFESGVVAALHLNYTQRPKRHTLEIVASEGTIRWDAAEGAVRWRRTEQDGWTREPPPAGFERNTLFLEEMRHFLDVIRGAAAPRCSLYDGVRNLELIEAVYRAASEGRRLEIHPEVSRVQHISQGGKRGSG